MNFVRMAAGHGPITARWMLGANWLAGQHARAEYLAALYGINLLPLRRRNRAIAALDLIDKIIWESAS